MVAQAHIWLLGPADALQALAELLFIAGHKTHVSDPYAPEQGASKTAIDAMLENAHAALGHIDTLVFYDPPRPREQGPVDPDDLVRQTVFAAACLLDSVSAVVLKMRGDRVSGQIIVVCDTSAVAGRSGSLTASTVGGALIGMSKSMAKELGRHRIAVNVICPGPIGVEAELSPAEALMFQVTGNGKPTTLNHLANNIDHLARGGHWLNGQILHVNDGLIM